MSALLGVIALLLAAAGLFATASYAVTERAREFAVRIALGADPRGLLVLVLTQSMKTVSIGFLIGGAIALGVSRLIASQFPGADGLDWGIRPIVGASDRRDAPRERHSRDPCGAGRSGSELEGRVSEWRGHKSYGRSGPRRDSPSVTT